MHFLLKVFGIFVEDTNKQHFLILIV